MIMEGVAQPQYKSRVSNLTMRLKCAFRFSPRPSAAPAPTTSMSWTHQQHPAAQRLIASTPMVGRSLSLPSEKKPSWAMLPGPRRASDAEQDEMQQDDVMEEDTPGSLPSLVESTLSDESKDDDESPCDDRTNGWPAHACLPAYAFVQDEPMLEQDAFVYTSAVEIKKKKKGKLEGILKYPPPFPTECCHTSSVLGKRPEPPQPEPPCSASRLFQRRLKKKKSPAIRFDKHVQVHATYSQNDYDRQSDPDAICTRLNAVLAHQIKQELNLYKTTEMPIHEQSKMYTHFFI
ncbi:hypothetical protein DM01DRAFT_1346468 [Hesseltinella vesiculosa]|uniref:Uncharacterized protein n=1 Tax=Hesseltinella vesiculosa TaxID=101127 RepID=A0A1X2GFT5_9FUNG|nr:hypothetical protein DM01DRAFT_1346468 [Hesseltinella vesiculosa]